jgi:hypothetical protein
LHAGRITAIEYNTSVYSDDPYTTSSGTTYIKREKALQLAAKPPAGITDLKVTVFET